MFKNREAAGEQLAHKLLQYDKKRNTIVLGIPRGGVVVAKAVADALKLPLDIIVVRKIGAPSNPELAIGAVGPERTVYWDQALCERLEISQRIMNKELRIKEGEQREREKTLRVGRKPLNVKRKTVILVDDGVATGATVLVAQKSLKNMHAKTVILAVPVIAKDTYRLITKDFERVVALEIPYEFHSVGQFYQEFGQVEDEHVVQLLRG